MHFLFGNDLGLHRSGTLVRHPALHPHQRLRHRRRHRHRRAHRLPHRGVSGQGGARPRWQPSLEPAVSLLAGIPSVVYGLVGMLVLVPGIRQHLPHARRRQPAGRYHRAGHYDPALHHQGVCHRAGGRAAGVRGRLPGAGRHSRSRPISGSPSPRPRAASPRRWCWAWAVPSARPWPS